MIKRLVGIKSKKVIKLKAVTSVVNIEFVGPPKTNLKFAFDTVDGWSGTYDRGRICITGIGYIIPELYEVDND